MFGWGVSPGCTTYDRGRTFTGEHFCRGRLSDVTVVTDSGSGCEVVMYEWGGRSGRGRSLLEV